MKQSFSKRIFIVFGIFVFLLISSRAILKAATLPERLKGKILLQVENNGEAWYIEPNENKKYFLGRPHESLETLKKMSSIILKEDLLKISLGKMNYSGIDSDSDGLTDYFEESYKTDPKNPDTDQDGFNDGHEIFNDYNPLGDGKLNIDYKFSRLQKGKIFFVENDTNQLWYIHPDNLHRYLISTPKEMFWIMKNLSLGVKNYILDEFSMIDKDALTPPSTKKSMETKETQTEIKKEDAKIPEPTQQKIPDDTIQQEQQKEESSLPSNKDNINESDSDEGETSNLTGDDFLNKLIDEAKTVNETKSAKNEAETDEDTIRKKYVRTDGPRLIYGEENKTLIIKGINQQNFWSVTSDDQFLKSDLEDKGIPRTYVTDETFQRVKDLGLNTLQIQMSYRIFEDNKNPFQIKKEALNWLSKISIIAKSYNISIILQMHVPQGGYQDETGTGNALWENEKNQDRFMNLWKEIATTYKNSSNIIGFNLLYHPSPTKNANQWKNLAQKTVDTIREVNPYHLIIIESVNNLTLESENKIPENFQFLINDPIGKQNIMYSFDYFEPYAYTHQHFGKYKSSTYPSESIEELNYFGDKMSIRAKQSIEKDIHRIITFAKENGVPINVSGFGPTPITFQENSGGYTYINDLIDIFSKNEIHYQYSYLSYIFFEDWMYSQHPEFREINRNLTEIFKKDSK